MLLLPGFRIGLALLFSHALACRTGVVPHQAVLTHGLANSGSQPISAKRAFID
ncbi:hypothetical protein SynBIOSE41_03117 [Synechococcus sp. BIOS-E4-1]|nr:hypothetical protein SynBIOSE41_03117 [Synechococcus sp. BIOS-E4-1]